MPDEDEEDDEDEPGGVDEMGPAPDEAVGDEPNRYPLMDPPCPKGFCEGSFPQKLMKFWDTNSLPRIQMPKWTILMDAQNSSMMHSSVGR